MQQTEGCYLLIGEDQWSKNKWLKEIKEKLSIDSKDIMNYLEAKDKEVNVEKLIDFAETLPFFTNKKLIYIKDSGLFKSGQKEESEKFEVFLQNLPDYLVLLIDESEVDKRSKLYKTVKAKYEVREFGYPGEEAVCQLLLRSCKEKGVEISNVVLHYFVRNMPENIAYILSEWEKLLGYIEGHTITQKAIDTICVFSLEQRVFELVKKIAQHEADAALQIYGRMIQSKESPIGILVLLGRQYRMMLQVKYMLLNKQTPKDIAAQLKLPFFAVKEMTQQVEHYKYSQIETIIGACLEADRAIKTGQMEPSRRVEILIMQCLNQ